MSDFQRFPGYRDDELSIIREFHNTDPRPTPGFIIDFLGVRTATDILWQSMAPHDGQVWAQPIPSDFHAEAVEWIGVLKAVKGAAGKFSVIELGAGFGTWAIGSAVAARSRGIDDIRIYMVEGDSRHCASAQHHFRNNGFDPKRHHIINAAVGPENGVAYWPKEEGEPSTDNWNNRPSVADEPDYLARSIEQLREIKVVAMRDLLMNEKRWNLVHLDVQGHEVDIVRSCLSLFTERVEWIVVGTHSRKIDGDFMQMMYDEKWVCENEKPAGIKYNGHFPTLEGMTVLDGTQVWRNPRF